MTPRAWISLAVVLLIAVAFAVAFGLVIVAVVGS